MALTWEVREGDCRDVMATMEPGSVDAVVCDPPYGLSFMGKGWDHGVPGAVFWTAVLRVAKPGAHLLAFGGTRTFHRLTCAIEDAGWEIRDCLMWLYGQGWPKSLDVSKAIDKANGDTRPVESVHMRVDRRGGNYHGATARRPPIEWARTSAATAASAAWQGYGTALKPSFEPIILARKPLAGTVAANVVRHGTGALNIDGCRIAGGERPLRTNDGGRSHDRVFGAGEGLGSGIATGDTNLGRWPANVALDGAAAEMLNASTSELAERGNAGPSTATGEAKSRSVAFGDGWGDADCGVRFNRGDAGGASRFFYTAKASRGEREAGLREAGLREARVKMNNGNDAGGDPVSDRFTKTARNVHPTVKPVDLMRWLVRLVTPHGGLVLDPFAGSGTTGIAAVLEDCRFIGIEREPEYAAIARARIVNEAQQGRLFGASP